MSLRADLVRNPVIMAADDDAGVLHAVKRDLSSHYSGRFRVLGGGSVAVMFIHHYLSEA